MATLDSLPPETLCKIMDMLKESSPRWDTRSSATPNRYDSLRAAALVCSRWREPAQRALFDDVAISSHISFRSQLFLASPAQPSHRTTSLSAESDIRNVWLKVAKKCSGLQSLELMGAGDRIYGNDLGHPCFADLRNLTMSTSPLLKTPPDPTISLPTRLSSLTLWTHLDDDATAFLGALLNASKDTLNSISLRLYDKRRHATALAGALSDVGLRLRRFAIDASPRILILGGYLDIFPVFHALEYFSWSGPTPTYPLDARDTASLRAILDAFPSPATLTHLSIGTSDFSSLAHLTTIIDHRTLALLIKLDLPSLPAFTPIEQASAVAAMGKACEDRGIRWSMGGKEV